MDDIENVEEKIDGEPAVSAGDSEPAAQRRNRHVMREAGVHADMEGADWTDWSMGRAARLRHCANDMFIRRTLRKIHIRPWHAPTTRRKELSLTAGVKQEVLNSIQVIIDGPGSHEEFGQSSTSTSSCRTTCSSGSTTS
jgi:hypothetical protein